MYYTPSLSSPDVPQSPSPASESAKIRLQEAPSLRVQGLKQRLRSTEAKLETVSKKHRDRQRLDKASTTQYARDRAAWEQRAASYEQQLGAQQSRLLEVTTESAAITTELREALHTRGEELASLRSSLHGKEMEISQVQTQFRELSSKFEAVQLELLKEKDIAATFQTELRRERDIAAAEREREMLALEDRMTRRIQASLALILAVML